MKNFLFQIPGTNFMQTSNLPLIAIIGRVNVGKSTLFNKLIEQRKALVSKIPGTTRDLNFGICEWRGYKFQVVDTGGLFEAKYKIQTSVQPSGKSPRRITRTKFKKEPAIEEQVEKKAREILEKADLILFMIDAKDGILKNDRLISQLVKKSKKPRLLVANKIDKTKYIETGQDSILEEFKKLGLGDPAPIAAISGIGVGDLLDKILDSLPMLKRAKKSPSGKAKSFPASFKEDEKNKASSKSSEEISVCIVGRPNVGKSSLLNKVLGEEKVIVSPTPHTTREPQDTIIKFEDQTIELVDTAGIRRKSKVKPKSLESAGIGMSIKALKKSDIALFVIDISENLTAQDSQLAGLIINSGASVIIVANKYDLIRPQKQKDGKAKKRPANYENDKNLTKELTEYIYNHFPFLTWAPIIFTSGLTGRNCQKILPLILEVKKARQKQIDEKELNEFLKHLFKKMPPPRQQRKPGAKKSRAFVNKITQKEANQPIFEISLTNNTKIPESYMRYIENNIRKRFKFMGTPIKIRVVRNLS